jgi:hypothetical protein
LAYPKIEKYRNHRRKQIEKQSIFVEDYAVEVIQRKKILIMLWGKKV